MESELNLIISAGPPMNDIVFGFREEVAVRVSTRATHPPRNLLVVSLQRHFNPPTHPPTHPPYMVCAAQCKNHTQIKWAPFGLENAAEQPSLFCVQSSLKTS